MGRIIVTMVPRSGSSLQMQIFKAAGVNVYGEGFPDRKRRRRRKKDTERAKVANPRGFYEVPGVVGSGLADNSLYPDGAIKIVLGAAAEQRNPHTGHVRGTSLDVLRNSKIVWRIREPKAVAISATGLNDPSMLVAGEGAFEPSPSQQWPNPSAYYYALLSWIPFLHANKNLLDRLIVVDYDAFLDDVPGELKRIGAFVGHDLSAGASEVDPALKRSGSSGFEWAGAWKSRGELCERVYKSVLERDYFRHIDEIYASARDEELRRVRWVDIENKTFAWINADMARSFQHKPEVLAREQRIPRFNPMRHEAFNQDGDPYTIELPGDLDNLARNKVVVGDDEQLTIEDFTVEYGAKS